MERDGGERESQRGETARERERNKGERVRESVTQSEERETVRERERQRETETEYMSIITYILFLPCRTSKYLVIHQYDNFIQC